VQKISQLSTMRDLIRTQRSGKTGSTFYSTRMQVFQKMGYLLTLYVLPPTTFIRYMSIVCTYRYISCWMRSLSWVTHLSGDVLDGRTACWPDSQISIRLETNFGHRIMLQRSLHVWD